MGLLRSSAQAHGLGHFANESLAANRNQWSGSDQPNALAAPGLSSAAAMPVELRPLDRPDDADGVLDLAWRVCGRYDQWVPYYLRSDRRRLLHGEYRYFADRNVRWRGLGLFEGGRMVATATAYVDPPLQEHLGRTVGLLGQFETEPDVDLSRLLDAAHEWLAGEGANEV